MSAAAAPAPSAARAMRRNVRLGLLAIAVFGGVVAAWSVTASVDSAVVAPGLVVVESNVKKVQHPTGGVVGALFVREGQQVAAGDPIVRLDETLLKASLGVVMNELVSLRARQARLTAERDGLTEMTTAALAESGPEMRRALEAELRLFANRVATRAGQRQQLRERVGQLGDEITGLREQKRATDKQIEIASAEIRELRGLLDKGLLQKPRITALEREIARAEGLAGELTARISQSQGRISETELQILQLDKDFASEVSKELREVETRIGELEERRVAAQDNLSRVEIRAPIGGVVHQLAAHTVGGVIAPNEPITLIVPQDDRLIVEARVSPRDIDQIRLGQPVRLRFAAFNQRTTPELNATLTRIAGDLTREAQTGAAYYLAGIGIASEELARLEGLKLIPGMPADVYIKTGERSPASYLAKPFFDHMHRAFRER
ncbi:MAG: HlyD family type I secretion periplasmic adaptor subunit [Methylobacteriaceae bacterium]|nr:HlyD family type I secretion periplasmic adaptor subunit [Methylobacteriaceae bacterium]